MFDFQKAINGEPVYFKDNQIDVCWYPKEQRFTTTNKANQSLLGITVVPAYFDKNGIGQAMSTPIGNLSTDPPKKTILLDIYYDTYNPAEKTIGKVFYCRENPSCVPLGLYNGKFITTIEVEF